MLDKYKELTDKGREDYPGIIIAAAGDGDDLRATLTYPRFDQDTGLPLSPITEGMTHKEILNGIEQMEARLEAWKKFYKKAFGKDALTKPESIHE
jgi:hypothetical protein